MRAIHQPNNESTARRRQIKRQRIFCPDRRLNRARASKYIIRARRGQNDQIQILSFHIRSFKRLFRRVRPQARQRFIPRNHVSLANARARRNPLVVRLHEFAQIVVRQEFLRYRLTDARDLRPRDVERARHAQTARRSFRRVRFRRFASTSRRARPRRRARDGGRERQHDATYARAGTCARSRERLDADGRPDADGRARPRLPIDHWTKVIQKLYTRRL